ncbi:hypothetical protein BGW80DRAFT_1340654 [Lactifluus volemus]|nr:hypothetical protein BGW80DRAFT_1340654 [Lactifluus volemus]
MDTSATSSAEIDNDPCPTFDTYLHEQPESFPYPSSSSLFIPPPFGPFLNDDQIFPSFSDNSPSLAGSLELTRDINSTTLSSALVDGTYISQDRSPTNPPVQKSESERKTSSMSNTCKICGKGFSASNVLNRHMDDIHSGQELCPQPGCIKALKGRRSLTRHLRCDHDVTDPSSFLLQQTSKDSPGPSQIQYTSTSSHQVDYTHWQPPDFGPHKGEEEEALQPPSPTATATASSGVQSFGESATECLAASDPIPTPPFVVTEAMSKVYYKGLPSKPPLIATTRPGPFEDPTGPEAYTVLKEIRVLGNHSLAKAWDDGLAESLCRELNKMRVYWTSLDALRIVNAGESSGPAIVWVGVELGSLSFEEGCVVAFNCRPIIDSYGIRDYHVEIRESRVMRLSGDSLFLDPVPLSDPTFSARDPFTATLGIPISTKNRPSSEGTGGFYLSAGGDDKDIYLVTARHVILPIDGDNTEYERKNNSRAREDMIVLGTEGFKEWLDAIDHDIKAQECYVITDAMERLALVNDADDPESVTERKEAGQALQKANEAVKALKLLRRNIATHWGAEEKRVFGELVWAPPIGFSTEPGKFTLDLAVIKVDTGKLDKNNYRGNSINIGNKYTRQQFMEKVYLRGSNPTSFKFPPDRLVKLQGTVPEKYLTNPPMLDLNSDPCLVVFKNGAKTGTTVGKANNVDSFTRTYLSGQEWVSREWPVIPTDNKSGAFSDRGDSGSCVADAFGRIGGIIIGGASSGTESSDVTYVTPISFIMKVLHDTERFRYAHLDPDPPKGTPGKRCYSNDSETNLRVTQRRKR